MKKFILFVIILSTIISTGCWDMVDLEDRILPYSVGIDLSMPDTDEGKRFFICFSYPNIKALGKGASQSEQVYLINSNANSIFDATSELSSRIHNPIFLKHLNVLIMSEKVYSNKKYLQEIIDGLQRDFLLNKMINIIITKESSHELLLKKLESKRQETVEGLIISLLQNEQKSNKFTPITLMDFMREMDNKRAVVVPLAIREPEISLLGGGLFVDYEFLGYIDENDNRNIAILNNKTKTDEKDFDYDEINTSISLYEIKSKKKLERQEDSIKIKYNVKADAQLHQYIIDSYKSLESEEVVAEVEKKISEVIKGELEDTIEKLQKDLNADALGILEYIYKFYPNIYKEVEKNWGEVFPHIDIDVDVKVSIRRRGLRNK